MANIENGNEMEFLVLEGESQTARTLITTGSNDPSAGAGETAPVGSMFLRQVSSSLGEAYFKIGPTDTEWAKIAANVDVANLQQALADMKEPTGHKDRSESQIGFNEGTRTFTISPIGAYFDYYIYGVKHRITTSTSIVIPDVQGMHFIYFNNAQQLLIQSGGFLPTLITDYAYTCGLYWDVGSQTATYIGEERHGLTMDGVTHLHLHLSLGTQFISGLALNSIMPDVVSPTNINAEIGVDNGIIRDEDIQLNIVHNAGGANPLTIELEQILSAPAQIPVLYRFGNNGDWKTKTSDNYPIIYSGTSGYVDVTYGLPAWNEWTGTTWQLSAVPNNHFVLTHIIATNDIRHPIVALQGIVQYQNKPSGLDAARAELLLMAGLPFQEFTPIGTLIWECKNIYTNTIKARLRTTDNAENYVDWRDLQTYSSTIGGGGLTDHGNLSGLLDDDHPQYVLTNGTVRPIVTINTTPSNNDVLTYNAGVWSSASPQKDKTLSTGLLYGGAISINSGNNTQFDVTAGAGFIVDNYTDPLNPVVQLVTWSAFTAVQSLYYTTSQRSFIAINSSGAITQKSSKFTNHEYRDNIVLGLLDHATFTSIINTRQTPNAVFDPTLRLTDIANGIGAFNISGNIYSPNGVNLKLNKTSGLIHHIGTNFQTDKKSPDIDESATETISQFRYSYRNGTGGYTIAGTVTDINPNFWDNNSGTLQTVPTNKWTIQLVKYMSGSMPGTATARIEIGQKLYESSDAALLALPTPPHDHNPAFVDGTLRAYLIVKASATDLSDTNQAIFYEAGKFVDYINTPKATISLQTVYNNSVSPELLTDSIRGALTIKEGSGVGGTLIDGFNQASTSVFSFDVGGNLSLLGSVDGRDIALDGTTLDNLVTEVNTVETSLGGSVDITGSWVGFSGTNFLNASTSISNALTIIDTNLYSPVVSRHNGVISQNFINPTVLFFDTSIRQDSIFTYSNGVVTISYSSWYRIIVNITLSNTTNNRITSESYLTKNGVEIVGSKAFGYHRDIANGNTTTCIAMNLQLTMGDQLAVVSHRFSGTGTLQTVQNACRLSIQRVT